MWGAIDLVLRFGYVALVPFLLPLINEVMPIAALLVGAGIATTVALVGSERWRAKVESLRFIGRPLSGFGRLGEFYASFPAKPLIYYILYPVLLPVILFMRIPRREFFLYRKLNAVTAIVIATMGAWDYFEHWRPELTFTQFAGATLGVFIMQMLVTFMFIMPIVTTLVELRQRRKTRTLAALGVLMLATGVYGAIAARHGRTMSIMTFMRLDERTKYARAELKQCEADHPDQINDCIKQNPQIHALALGLKAVIKSEQDDPRDDDAALAAAHEQIAQYYKPDEAAAFRLAAADKTLVVYAKYARKKAIWLGVAGNKFLTRPEQLPPALRKRLGV
jgi:hypothetical protein